MWGSFTSPSVILRTNWKFISLNYNITSTSNPTKHLNNTTFISILNPEQSLYIRSKCLQHSFENVIIIIIIKNLMTIQTNLTLLINHLKSMTKLTISIFIRVSRVIFQYCTVYNIAKGFVHWDSNFIANTDKEVNKITSFSERKKSNLYL